MGGGFANTELRSVSDVRVFDFFDFICLDDGETPIECLMDLVLEKNTNLELKRTFCLQDGIVKYINNSKKGDYKQSEIGTPDYSDLLLEKYISVIEIVNPMHRMWSDGRWNKLTMAHGCYWGKCTFCDISLDYIKLYEPIAAKILCDRIETLIAQTGQNGFHFVDEAAPPALMRALAIEIIKRKITVSWWTNIRFEKSFTKDLCLLLKASGCIAVSGGLEVASDRLLELIQKGVTVAQVAKVSQNFNEAGIMVHAYLMYGFPSQTAQETIDSLEMVRQMFEIGVLQSGFWHQFAMTEHSPVGMFPEQFNVTKNTNLLGSFANNDIVHQDATGTDHELFSFGLKKSLHNFMHGICFDLPLQDWFDFKIPRTKIPKNFIQNALSENDDFLIKPSSKIIWLGNMPEISFQNSKRGEIATLIFINKKDNFTLKIDKPNGEWIMTLIEKISIKNNKSFSFQEIKEDYESAGFEHFELLWYNKPFASLKEYGLLSF